MSRKALAMVAISCAALLPVACSEPAPETRAVRITGTASLPDGTVPDGTLHVQAYHASAGAGHLRHPLGELGGFITQPEAISGSVSYLAGGGEGLVIHAWLDVDGDGVHCTPANRDEPAGLTVVDGFPADEVQVRLTLAENFKSASWFFPPVAAAQ